VKHVELLQTVHARSTADALAKHAALHTLAMLKGEVVNQFTADQLGSTASSVSSALAGWQHPASPTMSSTTSRLPKPQPRHGWMCPLRPRWKCTLWRLGAHTRLSSISTASLWEARPRRGTKRLHEPRPSRTCPMRLTCSVKCQRNP
jgi:hypothetical protein